MHRDLNPKNIVFAKKKDLTSIKIIDFRLATLSAFSNERCGTPGYMAPEVANIKDYKSKYDSKCDIFSLGAIMYKL
jgi:serine/threonine protein kinase